MSDILKNVTTYETISTKWYKADQIDTLVRNIIAERDKYIKKYEDIANPLPPDYTKDIDPTEIAEYRVPIGNGKLLAVPNPKLNQTLFNRVIQDIATGKYMEKKEPAVNPAGIHPDINGCNKSKSQTEAILQYLLQGHSITPLEALELFGCFRLGARIADLKKMGYKIDAKYDVDTHTKKRYASYRIVGDSDVEKR